LALVFNILSWLNRFSPIRLIPKAPPLPKDPKNQAVIITGPGGLDRLNLTDLGTRATVGYNVRHFCPPPLTPPLPTSEDDRHKQLPSECVLLRVSHFSVNYADATIRWGLYESALRYVGWPIVPGFDVSGVVEWGGADSGFNKGDKVFGFTLFGGYSTFCLIPGRQLMKMPEQMTMADAAAAPSVAATALHACSLAGYWPQAPDAKNKAALVHSAAGGVGTMLLQMCKLAGFSPIVAVVGSSHKVDACKELGADFVIDKSKEVLWPAAEAACPSGYAAIFDANGVETLAEGFDHLAMTGRLVSYGFHSNLPISTGALNPLQWIRMGIGMFQMPKFDPMRMVLESKGVLGFNLSFFADEQGLLEAYTKQLSKWLTSGEVRVSKVTEFGMDEVAEAHALIQSGRSVGKIVLKTPAAM